MYSGSCKNALQTKIAKPGRTTCDVLGVKAELEEELDVPKGRLAIYKRDRERVQKVPTWTEAVFEFGKRHCPGAAGFITTQVVQNYRGNAMLAASQNQVAALMAQLVATKNPRGVAEAGIGVVLLMGVGALQGNGTLIER